METAAGIAVLPGGGGVAYSVTGPEDAPAILLNRPIGGSMTLWGHFANKLRRTRRVICFDPRGVGRSSDLPLFFDTRRMAEDARRLLDHLRVAEADVFGAGLGAMVASWLAADQPERVRRLVLASVPRTEEPSGSPSATLPALMKSVKSVQLMTGHWSDPEVRLVHGLLSPEFRARYPEKVQEIEALVRRVPTKRRNLVALTLAGLRHEAPRSLRASAPRTLLLVGARDSAAVLPETVLCRDVPGARVEQIPDAGCDVTLEQPEFTANRVLSFIGDAPLQQRKKPGRARVLSAGIGRGASVISLDERRALRHAH
jgi:3-oxoadipate enol-lactonase